MLSEDKPPEKTIAADAEDAASAQNVRAVICFIFIIAGGRRLSSAAVPEGQTERERSGKGGGNGC